MRGRNPGNDLSIRKMRVYRLLLSLGGEARWRDLRGNLRKLGWGPTTLKQTLDEMVREGSILKEARLGKRGAEVWYKVQISDREIWEPLETARRRDETIPMDEIYKRIEEKLSRLKDEEKQIFLKRELWKILEMVKDGYLMFFYLPLRVYASKRVDANAALTLCDYLIDSVLKDVTKEYLQFLLNHPDEVLEVIDEMLTESAKAQV